VPTFRAAPLTPKCDHWCEFPVADRPNAVRQFLAAAHEDSSLLRAPWLLMIETDYVWMGPLLGVPRAESAAKSWAFPYGYIAPAHPGAPFVSFISVVMLCAEAAAQSWAFPYGVIAPAHPGAPFVFFISVVVPCADAAAQSWVFPDGVIAPAHSSAPCIRSDCMLLICASSVQA
jgi:hypothetical protein